MPNKASVLVVVDTTLGTTMLGSKPSKLRVGRTARGGVENCCARSSDGHEDVAGENAAAEAQSSAMTGSIIEGAIDEKGSI